jgi:hypothetical protein
MTDDPERQRWERLRRALLNIVAQVQDAGGRYTFDIRIIPKDQQRRSPLR